MSRRLAILTGGLLWAAPLFASCGTGNGDGPGQRPPRSHVIEIRDMAFHPTDLVVQAGDTLEWINHDFVPHTATAPDSSWTSPPLAQGERWRLVVPPSASTYLCAFHPTMTARVTLNPPTSVEE